MMNKLYRNNNIHTNNNNNKNNNLNNNKNNNLNKQKKIQQFQYKKYYPYYTNNLMKTYSFNSSLNTNNNNNNNNNKTISTKNKKIIFNEKHYKIILNNLFKYNIHYNKFNQFIINYLIDSKSCNLVATFKDNLINDCDNEFLRRIYFPNEINDRIPKFSVYYKNYLKFFCRPTFNDFYANKKFQNYAEGKAEIYYNKNYN